MTRKIPIRLLLLLLPAGLLFSPALPAQHEPARAPRPKVVVRAAPQRAPLVMEKSGTLNTREWRRLRLQTDVGNVLVRTHDAPQVAYRLRLEASRAQPDAEQLLSRFQVIARSAQDGTHITGRVPWKSFRGRLWVNFEVTVPRNYHLDITTSAGNIEVPDMNGRVVLVTSGGNITAGDVKGMAVLETQGGHVTVQSVGEDLNASTAGGHVKVGHVGGNAVLRSAGGHVHAGVVGGTVQLETGGGNIVLDRAGGEVTAASAGGRIEFGETAGPVRARTAGGGIRVAQVRGPAEVETRAGSIQLLRIDGPVRASTSAGSITAWFLSDADFKGGSQLVCRQGDIVVYLPRDLAVTIDATVEMAADHRVLLAPGLPLQVRYVTPAPGQRVVRAEGSLNGGGQVLRLKTVAGNIRLQYANEARQETMLELERKVLAEHMRQFERQSERLREDRARELARLGEQQARELSKLEALQERLRLMLIGPRRVAPEVQNQKLRTRVQPPYPPVARQHGIQGAVRLDLHIRRDGTVEDVKVLSGHPLLVRTAEDAVRKWRYEPTLVDGKPVPVVTTVIVDFRLK